MFKLLYPTPNRIIRIRYPVLNFRIPCVKSSLLVIGKDLKLSLPFPPLHTVRETFTSYGAPSNLFIV
ncbi:hypothetical protein COI63_24455 [Bacillus toyonensis]|nr:hypothetical protein COI63_24455 [Bacillus toyonensis]